MSGHSLIGVPGELARWGGSRAIQRPLEVGFNRVPHICPVLADVGSRESARFSHSVRTKPHPVSGHDFSRAEIPNLEMDFSSREVHALLYQGTTLVGPTDAQINGLQPLCSVSGHETSRNPCLERARIHPCRRNRITNPASAAEGRFSAAAAFALRHEFSRASAPAASCQGTTSVVPYSVL